MVIIVYVHIIFDDAGVGVIYIGVDCDVNVV